jgi:hypothetical protein
MSVTYTWVIYAVISYDDVVFTNNNMKTGNVLKYWYVTVWTGVETAHVTHTIDLT